MKGREIIKPAFYKEINIGCINIRFSMKKKEEVGSLFIGDNDFDYEIPLLPGFFVQKRSIKGNWKILIESREGEFIPIIKYISFFYSENEYLIPLKDDAYWKELLFDKKTGDYTPYIAISFLHYFCEGFDDIVGSYPDCDILNYRNKFLKICEK